MKSGLASDDSTESKVSFSLQSVSGYNANTLASTLTAAMQNPSSSFYTSGSILSSTVALSTCGNQIVATSACSSGGGGGGLSGGAIAGIVVGVIVAVILLCMLVFCIVSRNNKRSSNAVDVSAVPSSRQGYTQEGSEFQAPVEASQSHQVEMVNYAKDDESKVAQDEVETGGEQATTEDITRDDGDTAMI